MTRTMTKMTSSSPIPSPNIAPTPRANYRRTPAPGARRGPGTNLRQEPLQRLAVLVHVIRRDVDAVDVRAGGGFGGDTIAAGFHVADRAEAFTHSRRQRGGGRCAALA